MRSSQYATIAKVHEWFHNDTRRLISLDNELPTLPSPRYVILGDGDLNIMDPIAELFELDCIGEMNRIRLRCPIVIRVHPTTFATDFKCQVSIRRERDNIVKHFSESTNKSDVPDIITQAHIAGSMPDLLFEDIKSGTLDHDTIERNIEERNFAGNEVCIDFYGLQLPRVEVCALPGPRANFAGGQNVETIIKPYLDKKNRMTIVVHLAHLPLATSWSLGLLEEDQRLNCAGLIVRRGNTSDDDRQVTRALSRDHRADLTLGWFQQSSLDRLRSELIYHNIAVTITWYVLSETLSAWANDCLFSVKEFYHWATKHEFDVNQDNVKVVKVRLREEARRCLKRIETKWEEECDR